MKKYILLALAIVLIVAAIFFFTNQNTDTTVSDSQNTLPSSNEDSMMDDSNDIQEETKGMSEGYSGKVLAGTTSQYLEFKQSDYEKALSENKIILLYFYANWCPTCRAEQPETLAAFNELQNPEVIGFRVNYKDPFTDADETALAKEFGIPYQHTKVIIKNGGQSLKSLETWDKEKYLEELS